jgi:hypothetical protein
METLLKSFKHSTTREDIAVVMAQMIDSASSNLAERERERATGWHGGVSSESYSQIAPGQNEMMWLALANRGDKVTAGEVLPQLKLRQDLLQSTSADARSRIRVSPGALQGPLGDRGKQLPAKASVAMIPVRLTFPSFSASAIHAHFRTVLKQLPSRSSRALFAPTSPIISRYPAHAA